MKITPFSFVHCADLHLDSPFECIQAEDSKIADVLRNATFRAFDNVIKLAIREHVDFLIVAGDVYDGADWNLNAQLRFHQSLRRAVDAGVQCFVAHGNHDPLSGWEDELNWPGGVHRFGGEEVERIAAKRGDEELAYVYGISYPSTEIRENLALRFPRERDDPFAIGVLHCNVGGSPDHDNYAPCNMDDLITRGMSYWALGHIHARNELREREPCIIYPGSTQGRSVRELGKRGCYLVKVDEIGHITTEFEASDVVRWFVREVNIADLGTMDALMDALRDECEEVRISADGRPAVLRVHLTGRGGLHKALRRRGTDIVPLLRESEEDRGQFVWVESVQVRTRPAVDIEQRRQVEDFVGEFLKAAEKLKTQPDTASATRQLLSGHRVIDNQLDQFTDEDLQSILEDAALLGLDWLLEEEE